MNFEIYIKDPNFEYLFKNVILLKLWYRRSTCISTHCNFKWNLKVNWRKNKGSLNKK